MFLRVVFPRNLLERLVEELKRCSVERVFFCLGVRVGDVYSVEDCVECPNVSRTPRVEFTADPMCTYRVIVEAEKEGREVTVIAHCHPAGPRPSAKDLRGMRLWKVPWVIVDSTTGGYAAWIIGEDGEPIEVKVETV